MYHKNDKNRPPAEVSDEASQEQLELARQQGEAYMRALSTMSRRVAYVGGEQRAGDYLVAFAIEPAEGMYYPRNGQLEWQEPQQENIHLEISVRDAADQRFIPGLTIYATLIDANGNEAGTHRQDFVWHPWVYHYGRNWQVRRHGEYTLRVRIEAPDFPRHDRANGRRYTRPVEVEFQKVRITPGGRPNQIWVSPREDGKWQVKWAGQEKSVQVTDTQAEAAGIGVKQAKDSGAELIILSEDGQIRSKRSYTSE